MTDSNSNRPTPPVKIQYGDIFIQIPTNDLNAIALAKEALEFMESVVRKRQEEEKKKCLRT